MPPPKVAFYERQTGELTHEPIYSGRFLPWAYGSRTGLCLTRLLFSRRVVSWLYGWINKQPWSRRKIARFVQRMSLDPDELVRPIESYRSFNDFITREIDLARRPLAPDPRACIAPADGHAFAYAEVAAEQTFLVKHVPFNLQSLLRDKNLAREYSSGAMVITRLSLADYHHFHFPASGTASNPLAIAGRYFAVTPYVEHSPFSFYSENRRILTRLATDHFGPVLMIEVGAFTVGSIRQTFTLGQHVQRGGHKGYFELGGSIVILLFKAGTIVLDRDLLANTRAGFETRVRMGESLGHAPPCRVVENALSREDVAK